MNINIGDVIYNIAYDRCEIIDISENNICVNYLRYNVKRSYSKNAISKVLFVDKDSYKRGIRLVSPDVDPMALGLGEYNEHRVINEYLNISNALVAQKRDSSNKAIRDICLKISAIDENSVGRFIPVINKMIASGDWVTALGIIFDNEIDSCFEKAVNKMMLKSKDKSRSFEKLDKMVRENNPSFISSLESYIYNYNYNDCSWILNKKIEYERQRELRQKAEQKALREKEFNRYKEKIEDTIKNRKINYLVHFTQIDNLPSILEYGLVPPYYHGEKNINSKRSDTERLINRTSLSVEFPNHLMFYVKRNEIRDSRWAVICFDVNVLLDEKVYFSRREPFLNECSFSFFSDNALTRGGCYRVDTLEDMFAEKVFSNKNGNAIYRKDLNIPDKLTTNPQAEICSCVTIPPKYIKFVYFESDGIKQSFINKYKKGNDPRFVVDYGVNAKRSDHKIWSEVGGYNCG